MKAVIGVKLDQSKAVDLADYDTIIALKGNVNEDR